MKFINLILVCLGLVVSAHAVNYPITFKRAIEGDQTQKIKEILLSDILNNAIASKAASKINSSSFLETNRITSNIWKPFSEGKEEIEITFKLSSQHLFKEFIALKETIDNIEKKAISRKEFESIKESLLQDYELTGSTQKEIQPIYYQNTIKAFKAISFRDFILFIRAFNFEDYQIQEEHYILNKEKMSAQLEKRGLMFAPSFIPCKLLMVANTFGICVSAQEKDDITYIITQMGTKKPAQLLFSAGKMNSAGDRIREVPTLQFLAVIFSNPQLKAYMKSIRHKKMFWDRMSEGVVNGLAAQNKKGILESELPGFCEFLSLDYAKMKGFVDRQDWLGFLCALI
jgi:hypothetical protein